LLGLVAQNQYGRGAARDVARHGEICSTIVVCF
jgi:hypothetical protein